MTLGMKILAAMASFLVGAIFVSFLLIALHGNGYVVLFPSGETQVEVLSLFLAAATLVITAVAIIVAIAAVVGYSAVKDAAATAGREAGDRAARETMPLFRDAAEAAGKQAGLEAAQNALPEMVQQAVRAYVLPGPDRTDELTAALAGKEQEQKDVGTPQN
jgi:hypothetical protein